MTINGIVNIYYYFEASRRLTMENNQSTVYEYNIVIDILAEMVTSYITKHSNLQKEELKNANKNDK